MKPEINGTKFGSITVDGKNYTKDILIRLNGKVEKRRKKLSKARYGTSHKISIEEAHHIYQPEADRLIFGTGQYGAAGLSAETGDFFQSRKCRVTLLPTSKAVIEWNRAEGNVIGLFHITC
ncbi:MAG: hypothetical protein GF388_07790 [Candidatus Aegiribacteria sp.]|nr:hypothetical protein [Candidatus Aegiribacteria sp.]MBD3295018.1 hypothetical protein [Candidatus Fermentibacteria bacterium]